MREKVRNCIERLDYVKIVQIMLEVHAYFKEKTVS